MTELVSLVLLAGLLAGTVIAWRRRARKHAAWAAAAAVAVGVAIVEFGSGLGIAALIGGVVLTVVVVIGRARRTSSLISRWGARTRRTAGVATVVDIARVASGWAMHRKAAAVRPSLGEVSWMKRARVNTRGLAVELCKAGGLRVWASVEDVILIFGGPRTGKTGWLGGALIDAPGAVLTTSTRLDMMKLTRPHRAKDGRPVWVFNPGGLGGLESTITFNPIAGCANPVTATERAADMIPETEGSERSYWEGQARRVLAALIHAAALGGLGMRDVLAWVANPEAAAREVQSLLRTSPEPAYVQDTKQWLTTNDKTRSSITSTMMPALGWLTSRDATAATEGDGAQFDVAELLRSRGTVYLLGRHEANTAPLLAALVGYIAREARRIAAHQPGGRLDPPLTLGLDEAARAAPIPLPDWTGDAGGSGTLIIAAFQSRADILDRYGKDGAAKILNNAGTAMLFGGTKDAADLDLWSKLAGDRDEPVITYGKDGRVTSRSVRKTPVLAPSQLAALPVGRAVVFRRGMPPVVGRLPMAWRRRDVRAEAKAALGAGAPTHASPVAQSPTSPTDVPLQSPDRVGAAAG